jgi:hypothetical protein
MTVPRSVTASGLGGVDAEEATAGAATPRRKTSLATVSQDIRGSLLRDFKVLSLRSSLTHAPLYGKTQTSRMIDPGTFASWPDSIALSGSFDVSLGDDAIAIQP